MEVSHLERDGRHMGLEVALALLFTLGCSGERSLRELEAEAVRLAETGRYVRAEQIFYQLAARAPDTEHRWAWEYGAAACLFDRGRVREAEQVWQSLYSDGYQHAAIGLGLVEQERGGDGLACFEGSDSPFEWALALYRLERWSEAAGLFGQLADGDPLMDYNVISALRMAGEDARVGDLVARFVAADEVRGAALRAAARECADPEHAAAMVAEADAIEELR